MEKVWYIEETGSEGAKGLFGPFDTYEEASFFLSKSIMPTSEEYMQEVRIFKDVECPHLFDE